MRYATRVKSWRISFCLLLPIAELATWTMLVAVPTSLMVYRFHRTAQGSAQIKIQAGKFETLLPSERWLPFALAP
jgi:hypothetical protein